MNLVFDISGHGYGHAAMSLPVLKAIADARADLRLTVRSTLPEAWLRARLPVPFAYDRERDFGMVMRDTLRVRETETLERYQALHADWDALVEAEAEDLARHAPDLVVSNVSYLAMAAAAALKVRRVCYSSLNWADVFWAYCGGLDGAAEVMRRMVDSYAEAETFIQPRPSMPMPSIRNGVSVAPVSRMGADRHAEIAARIGLHDGEKLLVVSLGGIPTPLSFAQWPRLEGWRVVSGADTPPDTPEVVHWAALDMPFVDVLASADAVVIKPGYGLVTEAACNGRPTLCIPRDGWPETEAELHWLARHARSRLISEAELRSGRLAEALTDVLARELIPPPRPEGVAEATRAILKHLPDAR